MKLYPTIGWCSVFDQVSKEMDVKETKYDNL